MYIQHTSYIFGIYLYWPAMRWFIIWNRSDWSMKNKKKNRQYKLHRYKWKGFKLTKYKKKQQFVTRFHYCGTRHKRSLRSRTRVLESWAGDRDVASTIFSKSASNVCLDKVIIEDFHNETQWFDMCTLTFILYTYYICV